MKRSAAAFLSARSFRVAALIAGVLMLVGCGGGGASVMDDGQRVNTLPPDLSAAPGSESRLTPPETANDPVAADATRSALGLALFDADPLARMDAASEVAQRKTDLDPGMVTEFLTTAAADTDPYVRAAALEAMGGLNEDLIDRNTLAMLGYALTDPHPAVREAAIEALVEMGGDESALVLRPALTDPDVSLREEAAYALGHIGGPSSIRLLRQLTTDPDAAVRQTAEAQLTKLLNQTNQPSAP